MYFTQEDYKKIENWLHRNSVKDTEFQEALPFTGKEIVTVVQDGHNRKVSIQEFINQLYKHGVGDFLNVTNTYRANNITLKEAIRLIPAEARKEGQVITFLNTDGNWEIYQFIGKLNQWNTPTLWNNPFDWEKFVVDSILPDEEDLTKSASDAQGNAYLSLKNRKYEPDKYSGLGRKILRRRVVEIEDPIYGTQEKNLLLQADFAEDNTVYVVRYDFTLNGQDITLPDNSYIEYEGGSISDGNIIDSAGGLNRIVLKKNIVNGKNILTQEMINKPNAIYEIRYDFDLNGEEITIPEGCMLDFNGGSISGLHTLTGSNTGIQAGLVKIFSTDVTLAGTWNVVEAYPEWFGAKGDGVTDDTNAINETLTYFSQICLSDKIYIINDTIELDGFKTVSLKRARISKTANIDKPLFWLYNSHNNIIGIGIAVIRSSVPTTRGVILLGAKDYSDTIHKSKYGHISNIRIEGTPATQDTQSIGIYLDSPGSSGIGQYFNILENMPIEQFNVGLKLSGDSNANYIHDITFSDCGMCEVSGYTYNKYFETDAAILLTKTNVGTYSPTENFISNIFHNHSSNGTFIYIDCPILYNSIVNCTLEAGGLSRAVVFTNTAEGASNNKINFISLAGNDSIISEEIRQTNEIITGSQGIKTLDNVKLFFDNTNNVWKDSLGQVYIDRNFFTPRKVSIDIDQNSSVYLLLGKQVDAPAITGIISCNKQSVNFVRYPCVILFNSVTNYDKTNILTSVIKSSYSNNIISIGNCKVTYNGNVYFALKITNNNSIHTQNISCCLLDHTDCVLKVSSSLSNITDLSNNIEIDNVFNRTGSFADKPLVNDSDIGIKYFCTSGDRKSVV